MLPRWGETVEVSQHILMQGGAVFIVSELCQALRCLVPQFCLGLSSFLSITKRELCVEAVVGPVTTLSSRQVSVHCQSFVSGFGIGREQNVWATVSNACQLR